MVVSSTLSYTECFMFKYCKLHSTRTLILVYTQTPGRSIILSTGVYASMCVGLWVMCAIVTEHFFTNISIRRISYMFWRSLIFSTRHIWWHHSLHWILSLPSSLPRDSLFKGFLYLHRIFSLSQLGRQEVYRTTRLSGCKANSNDSILKPHFIDYQDSYIYTVTPSCQFCN